MRYPKEPDYPYSSSPLRFGDELVYVRSFSPWAVYVNHPDKFIHEMAWDMLKLDARYALRRSAWRFWTIDPSPWTLVFVPVPSPPGPAARVAGRLLAAWAVAAALRAR